MKASTNFFFITCGFLVTFFLEKAHAQEVVEPRIAEAEKIRMEGIALDALKSKDITLSQYKNTISALRSFPCRGVDRSLSESNKLKLSSIIAQQEGVDSVRVLQSFRMGRWHIIYIDNSVSDEPYLFYPDHPAVAKRVGAWSGGATIFETAEIRQWTINTIKGIPEPLASCFAWHVTLNQD